MCVIPIKGNKFLVTGGAGFIGSHIAEELVKQGKQVVIVDDLSAGTTNNFAGWWNASQCDFIQDDVSTMVPFHQENEADNFDAIFHNAAHKCSRCLDDPLGDINTNIVGTFNMANMAHNNKAHFIHASTGSVNQGYPVSYYGVSKLAAEKYLPVIKSLYHDFKYTVLRYHHVYGPRQDSSDKGGVIPIFIRRVLEGKPITIFGDGEQIRHFTYVKDVVTANFKAFREGILCGSPFSSRWGPYYNVISGVSITIKDLARLITAMMGYNEYPTEFIDEKPGEIRRFDISGRNIMDSYSNNFEYHLMQTIEWYKNALDK
jgi:UDP-glucose 4-epimerase